MSYGGLQTQTCTYWAPGTVDGYGTKAFATPAALPCRFQRESKEYTDAASQTFTSAAVVYLQQAVELGGFIVEGTSSATNPVTVAGAYRIRIAERSQTPAGGIVVYKATLGAQE